MFKPSEIDGVQEGEVVYLKVYHNEEGTVSSLLNIDINPCVPVLDPDVQNNLVGEDVTCPGGEDGGIIATFDSPLKDDESMVLVFKIGDAEKHMSPPLLKSDFEGNILNYTSNELGAGDYTMHWNVKVGNNFIVGGQEPVTIGEPDLFNIELDDIINATCQGGNDGEITITPSGGSPPYTFNWKRDENDFVLPQGSTDTHLVNLPEGTYSLTLTDSHNCNYESQVFMVDADNASPQLDSHLQTQPGTYPNFLPTGSIVIQNIIGGSGNYLLHWEKDGVEFQPQNPYNLSQLESGSYVLTIEDADTGCSTEVEPPFEIIELDPLTVEITETIGITCEGDQGTLKAQGVGGTNSYSYEWSTGETTQSIHVGQGEYTVTVTDTGENIAQEIYQFDYANPLLTVEVNTTNVLCKDEATGAIELDVSGGTGGPYTIGWLDTQEDSSVRTNLEAGEYIYFVSDGECQVTNDNEPIVIEEPEGFFTVENISQTPVSLNGESDGSFEVLLENGQPPYIFSWTKDDQPYQPTVESSETNLVGLEAGTYQVIVLDAKGCQATLDVPIEINEPDPLAIIQLNTMDVSCKGSFTGSITAEVTGIPPFAYTWKKQGDISFSAPDQKTISGLSSGTYILSASDNSIVPTVTEVVVIHEPVAELTATAMPNLTECFLGNEGEIQIIASGGVAPYQYSNNSGLSFQEQPIFDELESGVYEVIVRDANQCEYQTSVILGQPDQTNAEFALSTQVLTGETVLAVDLSYPIPDTLEWVVPEEAIVLSKNSDELEMVFNQPGEYEVGVLAYRGDCLSTETKKILVLESDGISEEVQENDTGKKIQHFILYPNPTTGNFNVGVQLGAPSNISLKIFGLASNNLIRQEQAFGSETYDIPMDISGLPSGLYVVVLETQFGISIQKLILN
ncbi:T9SS type A sorting domain-containing protein [Muricauda oceani]|uniref:T9SS type A sorting domain-containing protein n=1 Tax=Flagellimonas oceani TaxID=2698672 RepID=A0A6G7J2W4_9FLAO|nr:T9SS type A sorting domain-containing protein [Allomuricauda oceani]MBW8241191.1 T9SS type A sorting domain-containing protein [Allomuricauda oceani]QII44802.1 T9SS type A sorting domain-containing protein [Allomuricauda oceani]